MEEKEKLRKSHPFLIEREIDDLYNIENKIHIDVDVFTDPSWRAHFRPRENA